MWEQPASWPARMMIGWVTSRCVVNFGVRGEVKLGAVVRFLNTAFLASKDGREE
jgi:hypothetical protein